MTGIQLIERQVYAMVGHPPLWEIIGPNPLRTGRRCPLAPRRASARSSVGALAFHVVELCAQNLHGNRAVLVLRFLGRGKRTNPVGICVIRTAESVVFTCCPPAPGCAHRVDADIPCGDVDLDLFGFGQHGDGCRRGVNGARPIP